MTEVRIDLSGPMFNGLARRMMPRIVDEAAQEVGQQAWANSRMFMDRSFKNPTPYYETQVTLDRVAPLTYLLHDQGIVYGPWLEGTGSRNRTTRFKGYASFRRATQQTKREANRIVLAVVRRHLPWLGG